VSFSSPASFFICIEEGICVTAIFPETIVVYQEGFTLGSSLAFMTVIIRELFVISCCEDGCENELMARTDTLYVSSSL